MHRRKPKINCQLTMSKAEGGCMASLIDQRLALALEAAQLGTWTWSMAAGTTDELRRLIGRPPTTLRDWAQRNSECFAALSQQTS